MIYFFLCTYNGLALATIDDNISLHLQDAPLRTALQMLSEQTKVDFLFSDELIDNITISCDFENVSLQQGLKEILRNTPITFKLFAGNQVVLYWRTAKNKIVLRGRVLDDETGLPLENVNVFIANSLIGSATNDGGEFVIPNMPLGIFDFVVSRIGYAVQKYKLSTTSRINDDLLIRLIQKPLQAPEIEVSAAHMKKWQKNLKRFMKFFFSTTQNASECKILNPFVLDFPKKKRGELTAVAQEPLIIENRALGYNLFGYNLYYSLEKFEASRDLILNSGVFRFEELTPETPQEEIEWRKNRIRAYHGSFRHFLAMLCENYNTSKELTMDQSRLRKMQTTAQMMARFHEEGFKVFVRKMRWGKNRTKYLLPSRKFVNTNDFLSPGQRSNELILHFPDYWEVRYVKELEEENYLLINQSPQQQQSFITLTADSIVINTDGHLLHKNFGITIFGYWAWERMADWLPWDYTAATAKADAQAVLRNKSN